MKEKGAEDALAAALAHISGSREIVSRSVLSGMSGFTCYHLSCDHEKRSAAYFWGVLERSFPLHIKAEVKGLRLCKDMKSVVFDLPTTSASTIAETWNDGYVRLSECLELPELLERSSDFYHRMRCNNSGWVQRDSNVGNKRRCSSRQFSGGFKRNTQSGFRQQTHRTSNNKQ
jgi:ATP-dependent RNA helicase DDX21